MNNKPASNFAKHVPHLPQFKKQVFQALSNQFGQQSQNDLPVYFIPRFQVHYKGPWKNSLPNGKGICVYPDGTYFQGQFVDGQPNDQSGLLILSNGATYRGSVVNSKINGHGKMRHNLGNKQVYSYQGTWRDGKPDGQGHQKYGDNSEYEGYFHNGFKHCIDQSRSIQEKKRYFESNGRLQKQSRYRSQQGQIYLGQFKNGLMHGFGQYHNNQKNIKYIGQFNNGKKKGLGTFETSVGKLTGIFQNDVITGNGQFQWKSDKKKYVGQFQKNQPHGKGFIQLQNGNILEGIWEHGHNVKLVEIISK